MRTKREAILNEINSLETQRNIIEFKDFLNDEDRENIQELNRKIKALREELLLLLAEGDTQKKVSLALIKRALTGDTKAFEVIRDTIGEKPVEQVQNLNPPVIKLERPNK